MTRYEAFIEKSWRSTGLTQLVVARIRDDGRAEIGFFLVDLWCLGVKDAFFYDDGTEAEFRELLTERLPEQYREPFPPACAKKMIDGAIAYAEGLGFAPHRDYRKARRALSGLDAAACAETFTFGREGRPCYVEGPDDTAERTERILALLEARCGADGFDFELNDEDDEAADEARDALREFFAGLGGDNPDFHEFAGMVAALHVCPTPVPPRQLLARLWGPGSRGWKNEAEVKGFMADLGVYWNYAAALVAASAMTTDAEEGPDPIDVYAEDFPDVEEPEKSALSASAFISWAHGFIRATQEWPEAWGDALTRPDLVPYWNVVRAWADPENPEYERFIPGVEPSDGSTRSGAALPHAALMLVRALRPPGPPTESGA